MSRNRLKECVEEKVAEYSREYWITLYVLILFCSFTYSYEVNSGVHPLIALIKFIASFVLGIIASILTTYYYAHKHCKKLLGDERDSS